MTIEGPTVMNFYIVAYTYKADNFMPKALIEFMVQIRELSPAALDMSPEVALNQLADVYGIDRDDENTFNSDDFPKVIFKFMVNYDFTGFVGYSDMPEYGVS
jgi:hypothetical protein